MVVQDFGTPEAEPADNLRGEREGTRSRVRFSLPSVDEAIEPLRSKFPGALTVAIAKLLGAPVSTRFVRLRHTTQTEAAAAQPSPGCLYYLQAGDEPAGWFYIEPSVFFPMLDWLLGGGGQAAYVPERAMTGIERRIGRRIGVTVVENLNAALTLQADALWTLCEAPGDALSDRPVAEAGFAVLVGPHSGAMRICLYPELLPRRPPTARQARGPVELSVTLPETTASAAELAGLAPGDILTSETGVEDPVIVRLAGIPTHLGRLGAYQGHRAITITSRVQ